MQEGLAFTAADASTALVVGYHELYWTTRNEIHALLLGVLAATGQDVRSVDGCVRLLLVVQANGKCNLLMNTIGIQS